MAEGKRPGGLTALAVLNFVFGGIAAIGGLLGFLGLAILREAIKAAEAAGGKYEGQSLMGAYIGVAGLLVSAILLIISGVGYLKQKRGSGRTMGNLYAVLSIATSVIGVAMGGGMGIGTIVFSIYPVLTLILLNGTFKDDLVN